MVGFVTSCTCGLFQETCGELGGRDKSGNGEHKWERKRKKVGSRKRMKGGKNTFYGKR